MNEPSNAELVRRIEELVRAIEGLTSRMETTYATKEAVQGLREVHGTKIRELEKDNEARAGFNRQIIAALVIGFVLLLIPLIGQIQSVVGGGTP